MTDPAPREVALLQDALELPLAERSAFIDRECGADAALNARMRKLLAFDATDWDLLDRPVDAIAADVLEMDDEDDPARERHAHQRIGPYRLMRELGRGGMGSVWLAERADGQFVQQVALKLIKLGMDNAHIERQFRRERALLARLQHPNIAQLIDGGIDDRGRPWFAMERVEGIGLRAWLDQFNPDLKRRLLLFVKLCRAVAHAHRHLIVHRDVKPSNVLVQADDEPRLLDFGIAKLVEVDGGERTATANRFLSRDFAAPEQVRGEAVSTATDVYALGLLLFELLTGQRYRAVHKDGDATLRPSATPAGASATAIRVSRAQLRGDLDAITMRALADDPTRRYAGAQALADDLQRHLDGVPVEARPDGAAYRIGKFVRRHRAAALIAGIGLVALIGASGVAFWQAHAKSLEAARARSALKQAEAVGAFMLSVFGEADPSSAKGSATTAGELLAAGRARVIKELSSEPAVAAAVLDRIGQTYVSLGEDAQARSTLAEAIAQNDRAPRPSLAIAASAGSRLAYYAFADGKPAQALRQLDALIAKLDAAPIDDEGIAAQLAKAQGLRGSVLYATGRKEEARAAGQASVAAWSRIRDEHASEYLFSQISLADLDAALGHGDSALQGANRVLADPFLHANGAPPALLAHAHAVRVRALQALGRHEEAEPLLRETIAEFSTQYGADATMTRYWRFRHAETLHALGRLDEAQTLVDAVLALPPDGSAAYRRTRVEVLGAQIALDRRAADAGERIAAATLAACGDLGNAELCDKARALGAAPAH